MGFNDDKKQFLSDLRSLNFDHQARTGRDEEENLLAAGLVSAERAVEIVTCTKGQQHQNNTHHLFSGGPDLVYFLPSVEVGDCHDQN